ncbi:cupin domain-containing protein [Pusillimonas sp.]|uniref:cupin domain-containing protein n=1 Tax=Pusillimonas sp. TaxID=3040095 RepID=UPI0029AC3ED6|nr:cupin domain-containing protein [Pusillimonas sp.]MDX3895592.1 cupin domain-containing protein [Pusillimonas sp.]
MPQTSEKTMAEFNEELADMGLRGQWIYDDLLERLVGGPKPVGDAHIWKWDKVEPKLMEMLILMQESYTARRNFSFINPAPQVGGTTQTILAGMQVVKPGEVAWGHRHPISALRFAIEGSERLYTVVNGEPLKMEKHDLVLTPAWTWHDHHNDGENLGIWLDVLDVPLVRALGQMAYEPLGEVSQPVLPAQPHPSSRHTSIRPRWEPRREGTIPYRYAWSDVERQMQAFADVEGSPYDGQVFEYANPGTGGPTLPTLACAVHNFRPGFVGGRCRKTSSTVFYVVEGEGTTIVGDKELKWGARDVFSIPSWVWYEHRNNSSDSRAVLFSTDDSPLLVMADLYRNEVA